MSEKSSLRVHLEFDEAKADFEGDVDQVFEAIIRFLTQIYPNLEIVQKIVYTPNLTELAEKLVGIVEITSDGLILVSGLDLSAKDAICLALLGTYVGNKLGKMRKETLSSSELAKTTGKARKTISNEIPRLTLEGLVERTAEGEYGITALGIRKAEDMIKEHRPK
jgi:hypothetical protein